LKNILMRLLPNLMFSTYRATLPEHSNH
jgi:hypothetical protein